MPGILALIPYYGGAATPDAAVGNSPQSRRPHDLWQTIESLTGFAIAVAVGVIPGDSTRPQLHTAHDNAFFAALPCEPRFIPGTLCRSVQDDVEYLRDFDFVYVTEADQVLNWTPEVLREVSEDNYLVPHRWEETYHGRGADRGAIVNHGDRTGVLINGNPVPGPSVYHPGSPLNGYGGAFLCTTSLFRKIRFSDSPRHPVETVTGFAAYEAGYALKTCQWNNFFVEHLSGLDYHKTLA